MPRRPHGTAALAAVALMTLLAAGAQAEVTAAASHAEALSQAQQNNQLVIIDFFTDW